jgi:hypothetical protein
MSEYRLFKLNDTGMVDLAETGWFADDDAAKKRAALFGEGTPVEVWQGRRRIAVVSDTRATARAIAPYAFHEVEPDGRTASPRWRDFGSDNAAMAHALKLSKGRSVEVWSQDRHVATLRSGAMA